MVENLVIVESPAKAKTIEKILGSNFSVTSSFGHIRDLDKKDSGIDIENGFIPNYIIPEDKKKVVTALKKAAKAAKTIWIASDEDREGEAIAWHIKEVLKLTPENSKRIVFHEITEKAIKEAIDNPREIDNDIVNAQQARRVLDRLVGFEISPVLWKKVKPSLSAGRVQSVSVKLLVEREREIANFVSESSYRVTGDFAIANGSELNSELNVRFNSKEEASEFIGRCVDADFLISDITTKPAKKSPAAPFITSTLQQEASRKLGFPVSMTMSVAQKLYENGHITYMRTDSTNLSEFALGSIESTVKSEYGDNYHKFRTFKAKAKGAQEAHEAIRPTNFSNKKIDGTSQEKKLYSLIWKRTVASQMADAKLEKTTVTTEISTTVEKFIARGEVLIFDGFLSLYIESSDDDGDNEVKGLLPQLALGEVISPLTIDATQKFSLKPPRYSEASLVRKMEELGIGRPSTYAPVITTVQNRGYVEKGDRDPMQREIIRISLKGSNITEESNRENYGAERNKLFPTDIGMVVTDFLTQNFPDIIEYSFTAKVEHDFDKIASGKLIWNNMIGRFYKPFHTKIEDVTENAERFIGERILGIDPVSGKRVSVRIGKYGPLAQLGSQEDDDEDIKYSKLDNGQSIERLTLEEAMDLFKLPRDLGLYEESKVAVNKGRFGPYILHNKVFVSIKEDDPMTIELDRAIVLIEEKREKDRKALLRTFEEDPSIRVIEGRWGPYISYEKKSYKIPKGTEIETLSLEDCKKFIEEGGKDKKKAPKRKKAATKKSAKAKTKK